MRKILKHRFSILIVWIIATVVFTLNQPNFNKILGQKGEATISENSPSVVAQEMINKMGTSKGDSLLLVFSSDKGLSGDEMNDIKQGIDKLNQSKEQLQITDIIDPFSKPEAKDQMISKDNTTVLASVSFEKGERDRNTVMQDFNDAIKDVKVNHYITGSLAINNDYQNEVAKSIDKSAIITVGFILVVLILMFRSVVTPIVTLLAVGLSYICSMGIIGVMVNQFNFPATNFTQMFVCLVLFGIGTDYHILLLNRFKEELSHGLSVDEAIVTSYKTSGKTILYSGLTVLIAFASLTFVQFSIYKSANAVAIGIAILLIEMFTFTPIAMKLLGGKLFWPSKEINSHKENGLWGRITSLSVKHPVISLLVVAIMLTPIIAFNANKLSFDNIKDLSETNQSVKGFNIITDKFSAGKVMQTTVVLESEQPLDNNEDLAIIDNLTEKLKGIKGIKEVSGPTQPMGNMIDNFYTNKQTNTVVNGLSSANDGIGKVKDGLNKMDNSLYAPDFSSVKDLSIGTGNLKGGMDAITNGLVKINDGIAQGANGADNLATGIGKLKTGVASINGGLENISSKITEINNGYTTLGDGYKSLEASIIQLKQLSDAMKGSINNIDAKLPNDPDVAALKEMSNKLSASLDGITSAMDNANKNYDTLASGLKQVNEGLKTVIDSTGTNSELVKGINELENGAKALSNGLRQGNSGQEQVIKSMAQLRSGADKIKTGQDTLYNGLNNLSGGMTQLKDGLNGSSNGLSSISDGIDKSNDFLNQLTNTKSFYIPDEAFNNADITKMFDAYMSDDRKIAKLTITLDSEPYSDASINLIDNINTVVENNLSGTKLSGVKYGVAGATANSNDLSNVATHDITFTQIIVLGAIFILLVIIIRSFWIPVYIVGSLGVAYYAALSATGFISKMLFSSAAEGLSWNVPFFSFIMIAALGVDYSIFLMMRFKEYSDISAKEAIIIASRKIGGVVMSAAIILAGTFATLYPSNIVILMELAIAVVIGLFLLAFVLLPVAIPALMSISEDISKKSNTKIQEISKAMKKNNYIEEI
ncbi:MMPL family transporter [Clostridium chromiireducens]|uniref:Putative membrane protein YdgH n=1 Tax=Clostridium chromiireducens TaxID=225345 RepID=A0A1V4ILA6_9CLOT|nr:MMPL family transporter [Clostridium chromiireducens]OPJ60525.1 putative membrane protein YdgH [Clostridium chromiireducens]